MPAPEYNGYGREVGKPKKSRKLRPIVRERWSGERREAAAFAILAATTIKSPSNIYGNG